MGFRKGAYATVWEVRNDNGYYTVRISTSRKDKQTGDYVSDFSGFARLLGNASTYGSKLKEKDRIKIGDCDVSTYYDKQNHKNYTNFTIFDLELQNSSSSETINKNDEGNIDNDPAAEDLPF